MGRRVYTIPVCPVCGVKLNRSCRKIAPADRRPRPHIERAKVEAEARRRWETEGIPWT